jgi:hypothetical protein
MADINSTQAVAQDDLVIPVCFRTFLPFFT